ENLWLDSVSLIIKDSFDGELMIIDNLSGSVFHHYSSPAMCEKCNHDKQEVTCVRGCVRGLFPPDLHTHTHVPTGHPMCAPRCRLCRHSFPFLQVQLAEMEALSLNSDKSSSILLGDE
ncbi:CAC1I protein, partial [Vidua macroura]|nr:CAC1I protein [Vidua chalybeata]NXQ06828.1 CAC1I protein [Vidua macroura]